MRISRTAHKYNVGRSCRSPRPVTSRALLGVGEMYVVDPLAGDLAVLPEPGELVLVANRLLAAVFLPMDIRLGAQDAGAFLAAGDILGHEGADVEANAIVDVRRPTDGLILDGLPADEEVDGWFACEDGDEPLLQLQRGGQTILGAAFAAFHPILLACNPVAEVAVGE